MDGIEPVIVDPSDYDRVGVYGKVVGQCRYFLKRNGLREPRRWEAEVTGRHKKVYGVYFPARGGRVCVNLSRTPVPVRVPGFRWSYAGYKSDLTVAGVVSHEVGHHVESVIREMIGEVERERLSGEWRKVVGCEKRVSSYEPNGSEAFAEAMRLFILNPDFLRRGRPMRYGFLAGALGFVPPHDLGWDEVLRNAHPRLLAAARSWIGRSDG